MSITKFITQDNIRSFQYLQALRLTVLIVTAMILVKIGLEKDEVSIYEWVIFFSHAISFFWSMGLKNGLMNYYPTIASTDRSDFIKSTMVGFMYVSMVVMAVVHIVSYTGMIPYTEYLHYLLFYMFFNINASLLEQIYLIQDKPQSQVRFATIGYFGYLIMISFGAWIGELEGVLVAMLAWSFFRYLYYLVFFYQHRGTADILIFRKFMIFCLPLILHVLLGNGMEFVDGFLVEHFFKSESFAIYRFGARELPFNTILVTSLVTATIPLAITARVEATEMIKSRLKKLMHWLFPLSIILLIYSETLFEVFYSRAYVASAEIFNIYILIIISRMLVPQVFLYARQKNKMLVYIALIELIINISLSMWFLKIYGLKGIAYATLVAYIAEKVMLMAYAKYRISTPIASYLPIKPYISYSVILLATYYWVTFM